MLCIFRKVVWTAHKLAWLRILSFLGSSGCCFFLRVQIKILSTLCHSSWFIEIWFDLPGTVLSVDRLKSLYSVVVVEFGIFPLPLSLSRSRWWRDPLPTKVHSGVLVGPGVEGHTRDDLTYHHNTLELLLIYPCACGFVLACDKDKDSDMCHITSPSRFPSSFVSSLLCKCD